MSLADIDPVGLALAWLKQHPRFVAEFGSAAAASGVAETPWPHVLLRDGEASGLPNWRTGVANPEVTLEVYSDPAGTIGKAALRRLALVAVECLTDLCGHTPAPGEPTVTDVASSGTFSYAPLSTGQKRYVVGVYMAMHF